MKGFLKYLVLITLCSLFFGFSLTSEVWSAPKGRIIVAQGSDPTTLDPHMHTENPAHIVLNNIYEFLVSRQFKEGKLHHEPMLATSWETIDDKTWIFHLRKGVKFHNGEDFNAEAVKYTLERVLNPAQKSRRRFAFTAIDRVDIVDSYTVRIKTKTPSPTLIANLGFSLCIVPPKYFKEKGDAYVATHPVGTGPFRFVRWVKDEEIVLDANEIYWDRPANIKTLIFKPIPEDSTRVAALLGGDVDIAKKVPFHMIPMVNKSDRAKVLVTPGGLTIEVVLDTLKEGSPLRDKRVRQAINYAVDKENIIKNILEGNARAVGSPLNPAHFGYDPSVKPYPYDPQKAKALLKESGYGGGLNLTFNSPSGRYDKDKEFAEAIAGQLAKVGIKVEVKVHEWGSYMKKVYSPEGAGPMYTWGWASSFDADAILTPLLSCGEPLSKYCNKQFNSLLDQARITLDPKQRQEIYTKALRLIHDDAAFLFLHQGFDTYGVSNRIQNWEPIPDEPTALKMYNASVKD